MKEKTKESTTTAKNQTVPLKCTCTNKYQDEKYGKSMRVKNSTAKGFRCTSCGSTS